MSTERNLEVAKEIATDMELYLELANNEVDEFATRLINRICADKEDEIVRLTAQVAMQAEALKTCSSDWADGCYGTMVEQTFSPPAPRQLPHGSGRMMRRS